MAKMNVWKRMFPVRTHEGALAQKVDAKSELRRTVLTCLLWEDTFYEKGNDIAKRIAALAAENKPEVVAALAREARGKMQLRHAPLFLVRELARRKGAGPFVAETLEDVIQRADELGEFVALYWKEKKQPLSAGVKRGLARAFTKFDAYQLAKYDRESAVKLRDVLFLCHAKPKDEAQAALWKKLVENTLESPDTWEVALSAGKDKRENFERRLREGKLGGMAVLRNLRLMLASGVDPKLIRERLDKGVARALPFRFVTAARHAPKLEDALEKAMLKGIAAFEQLAGSTGLVVDVSGSMNYKLSKKGETTRLDAPRRLVGAHCRLHRRGGSGSRGLTIPLGTEQFNRRSGETHCAFFYGERDGMIGDRSGRCGHRAQKFHVGLRLRQAADQKLHGLDCRERAQNLAQHPHAAQLIRRKEQFVLARAGTLNVDGGEDALIREPAVEVDFHVAGALELLEDDIVHAAAGID